MWSRMPEECVQNFCGEISWKTSNLKDRMRWMYDIKTDTRVMDFEDGSWRFVSSGIFLYS
jgi:hypothetical protein